MKNGWKISRLYRDDGELAYIYCDIIQTEYDSARDSYIFTDLLADVIVENNGAVHVVDLDELADAFQQQLITAGQLTDALHQLDHLLALIYSDGLEQYFEKMKQALSPIEKDSSQ
jgi:predicted RNA-binding protein associated with RNAse of E/G family